MNNLDPHLDIRFYFLLELHCHLSYKSARKILNQVVDAHHHLIWSHTDLNLLFMLVSLCQEIQESYSFASYIPSTRQSLLLLLNGIFRSWFFSLSAEWLN